MPTESSSLLPVSNKSNSKNQRKNTGEAGRKESVTYDDGDDDDGGGDEVEADLSWRWLFYFNVFFSCVSFSIILPSLQPYLERNTPQPHHDQHDQHDTQGEGFMEYLKSITQSPYFYGYTVAVYSLGEMVGAVVFGGVYEWATRRFKNGAKYTLILTILIGLLGSTLYISSDILTSPSTVFFGRFFQGIWTGGKQVTEQSYISQHSPLARVTELTAELGSFAILGFVTGPLFGVLFSRLEWRISDSPNIVVDAYTAPGYFILVVGVFVLGLVWFFFEPVESVGFDRDRDLDANDNDNSGVGGVVDDDSEVDENGHVCGYGYAYAANANGGESRDSLRSSYDDGGYYDNDKDKDSPLTNPNPNNSPPALNKAALLTILFIFFIHFFSFSIQETITTPYVIQTYNFTPTAVNVLFTAVGCVSLVTSVFVRIATTRKVSDFVLMVWSLGMGFGGCVFLVDDYYAYLPFSYSSEQGIEHSHSQSHSQTLPLPRFLLGFTLLTISFPLGRAISLSMFTKLLNHDASVPQGKWFGYMFSVGALPRVFGPCWSLYALKLGCELEAENNENNGGGCEEGGVRTWVEFGVCAVLFLGGLGCVGYFRKEIQGQGGDDKG